MVTAIGTGGIKPCVSAFGGDQFVAGQVPPTAPGFIFLITDHIHSSVTICSTHIVDIYFISYNSGFCEL